MSKTRTQLIAYLRGNYGDTFGDVVDERMQRALDNALRLLRPFEWRFMLQTVSLTSIVEYSTGTLTTPAANATTIEFAGATLPTDIVTSNAFLEINGETKWYEIVTRTDADTLEIRSGYTGASPSTAALTYRIIYPLIELPANFKRLEAICDSLRGTPLGEIEPPHAWWLHAGHASSSEPTAYAILNKRTDTNVQQLLLYPPPGIVYSYEMTYLRDPGWYTTATTTWKREATADTDVLDWPDKFMDLFYAAARVCLYREADPFNQLRSASDEYAELFDACSGDDKKSNALRTLQDGGVKQLHPETQWIMPAPR